MTKLGRTVACLSLALVLGCGGDDGPSSADAPRTADAPASGGPYTPCTMGVPADCPAGFTCQVRTLVGGSTTEGYCSPPCADDPDCALGYSGPGEPTCFMANACVLVCTDACPTGLTCLPTGGPVDICGVAQ